MSKLEWDKTGQHYYETGVDQVVLYPMSGNNYGTGVAWNGVTSIEENPSGADFNAIYADNIKYLNIQGAEEFGATIGAYTYPPEFEECNGAAVPVKGVTVGQQARKPFGLCYRTVIGNDTEGIDFAYKLHLVYGGRVTPSSKSYGTINESPEPAEMSWEMNTTPVKIEAKLNGKKMKPTSIITIDSRDFTETAAKTKLEALENLLYGTDASGSDEATDPQLPLPDVVLTTLGFTVTQ